MNPWRIRPAAQLEVRRVKMSMNRLDPVRLAMAAVGCLVALGACAREIGQPLDAAAVETLTPGRSTYADVVREFRQGGPRSRPRQWYRGPLAVSEGHTRGHGV